MPAKSDPTAHFTIYGATVTVCDNTFTIPPAPAATWLTILTDEQTDGALILPGMLNPKQQETMDQLLITGELTMKELTELIQGVITTISGHPWWWTLGLLSILRGKDGTQILGEMSHINPEQVSLGNWVNTLYARLIRYMKDQDRIQFDTQLDTPPPDIEVDPEELIDETATTSAFYAMMNQANS